MHSLIMKRVVSYIKSKPLVNHIKSSFGTESTRSFHNNLNFPRRFTNKTTSNVPRGPYSSLRDADVNFFKSLLSSGGVIEEPDLVEQYNTDWMRSVKGFSSVVLRPQNTDEVSKIMAYCHERNLAVCPQGGNTGLVGGSVPVHDEIILSTSRMNTVEHLDNMTGVLVCQGGCILENLEAYVSDRGFTVPLDLGAKGSCQIGGNVATNAGGLRLVYYGSLHANVLGLEVVLANGEVLSCMNTLRKDNTGYDLKHIFIGSEGTLGIITKVAIMCYPKPSSSAVAFLGCFTFDHVLQAVQIIRKMLPEILTSLEVLDDHAADSVRKNLGLSIPIDCHPFYLLLEVSGSNGSHNEEKLHNCLNTLMEQNVVSDGTLATEPSRMKTIWAVRERITESLVKEGYGYKYDISLPLSKFYEIVEIMRKRLADRVTRCCGYGHLGDGNVHFNVVTPTFNPDVLGIIEPFIYKWVSEQKGSISAEHGIGLKKKKYLHYCKTPAAISLMRSFKQMMDPKGILNPYKLLP